MLNTLIPPATTSRPVTQYSGQGTALHVERLYPSAMDEFDEVYARLCAYHTTDGGLIQDLIVSGIMNMMYSI
jgi:hypothetical protein